MKRGLGGEFKPLTQLVEMTRRRALAKGEIPMSLHQTNLRQNPLTCQELRS